MRKKLFRISLLSVSMALLAGTTAWAQSAYFQAVTNLNPAVYFPLQETVQPPIADVETNNGSLGVVANAIYSGHNMSKAAAGATADGDTSATDSDGWGGFLAVPTTDPRTAVSSPTFTVEAWINSAEQGRNFEGIVAKAGGNTAGINGANNQAGWCLSQNYIAYLDNANLRGFDFHVFNGIGHEGAEVIVPYNIVNGTWYHVVATFDGTNCRLYVNGVDMVAAGGGFQITMAGSYVPDTWNQLQIGSSRNLNGNNYHGSIDEVAIYTNLLSPSRIQAHYTAASSATPYSTTILADNPYMYWRMDSPGYTAPNPSTYPAAAIYGANASSFGAMYGTASQTGVAGPQFPGLLDPSNGNASYGVAINGIGGNNGSTANVPVGYDGTGNPQLAADAAPIIVTNLSFTDPNAPLLNPTNGPGNRVPFSVTIWFKANPHDWSRFQTIFGHSDSGWRMSMNTSGVIQWNPGPGGETATPYIYDDGKWHQFIGTYDGTNVLTYVDGLKVVTTTTTGTGNGSALYPMLGGDPFYLDSGNAYAAGNGGTGNTTYRNRNFSGRIAHFAFFTNTLSSAQVQNLYTNAVPNQAPYILAQPVTGRVNPAPAFLFFGTVANGTGPLSYQWYFNTSSNYTGATQLVNDGVKYALVNTSQMTVSNLTASDSGYYFVVITNNSGSVTSILASLSANYLPVITAQSPAANFSLFQNQMATLSVTVISETNLFYQWYANGVGAASGTNSLFVSAPVTTAGTSFYCIVTNVYGSATSVTVSASSLLPLPAALTNSPFGSNILALNPTAYWPMHETGQTPTSAAIETNYSTLGSVANGYYGDWQNSEQAALGVNIGGNQNAPTNVSVLHQIPGAIAGDPNPAVNLFGANNSFIVIPRTSPQTTLRPPFTLEAWLRPNDFQSFFIAIGEDSGTFNSATNSRGGFDWLYAGAANSFSMTVYNGNGGGSTEPKTTANYPPGQWYHVVTTFDGTNVAYYINGVQDPLVNSSAATMNLNTWDPLTIGCGRGYGQNMWRGSMDEVAIYTNLLPLTEIQKHYNDGTNAAYANYKADVLADNPIVYYRMDAPTYVPPALSTWPVLTNYGSVGINGVYHPGAIPAGGAGPSEDGVAIGGLPANTALAGNGTSAFADAGFIPQFSPTGKTPFSVAAWMMGNPGDSARGWQTMVGHGDSAWRLVVDGNGTTNGNGHASFNAGPGGGSDNGNGPDYTVGTRPAPLTINDGNWHYVVGTWDGTNDNVYVDGLLSSTAVNTTANITSQSVDVFLGGYPNNTIYSNTLRSTSQEIGRALAGSLCEAAFWNGVALTTNQIQTLYNSLQVAPVIDRQPVSASVNQNSPFTNTVLAAGSPAPSYQWYENGLPRSGQTNASLILASVTTTDASTNWNVVVANSSGAVTSSVVSLTVFSVPTIITDLSPTNVILYAGGHLTFALTAIGAVPLRYQWYSNSVGIVNATNFSYALTNAQPPSSTNNYFAIVTNSAGSVTSSVVVLTVLPVSTAIPYYQIVLADKPFGFWPLNEPEQGGGDGGVIANDYWAGNSGIYTNVTLGQPGFNPTIDTNGTSAEFGVNSFVNGDVYGISTNVDFSATNSSSNFSIEAWVKGFQQTADAGIISKGYGGGGEQFDLDTGANGGTPQHAFRFFVRNAAGTVSSVVSSVNPNDGLWHHLCGVCDESSNAVVTLYIDGLSVGTSAIASGSGILASPRSMLIGSRPSNSATNVNDFQFVGWVQNVAVYNYALSAAQVAAHFNGGDIPASIVVRPTNTIAGEFGNATFTAVVIGTPPIGYQWFVNSLPLSGQTNVTLVVSNVQFSYNNNQYYLQVTNAFGTNDSSATPATLTVVQGLPQIQPYGADVPAQVFVLDGGTASISVIAYGTMPLAYHWRVSDTNAVNWTNLSDTARITGSLSNVLTIANAKKSDAGSYQVIITNIYGSIASSVAELIVGSLPIGFNGNGVGWTGNQGVVAYGAPFVASGLLTLTENVGSQVRSFFFNYPQYIGAFKSAFTYQDVSGAGNVADGVAFILQNDPRGTSAIGGAGGSLGVSGITPSWELELNIYVGAGGGMGYSVNTNGGIGPNTLPGSVNFASGDPIGITVYYANGGMALTFTDAVTHTSFSTNLNVGNLTQVAGGSTAYIGFSGATGGSSALQTISNFSFVSLATEAIQLNGTNVLITWPGAISGYALQQNSDLTTTNWVNVTNLDSVVNGLHQVIVPVGSSNAFYRLNLQP